MMPRAALLSDMCGLCGLPARLRRRCDRCPRLTWSRESRHDGHDESQHTDYPGDQTPALAFLRSDGMTQTAAARRTASGTCETRRSPTSTGPADHPGLAALRGDPVAEPP